MRNYLKRTWALIKYIGARWLTFAEYIWYAVLRKFGLLGYLAQAIFVAVGSIYTTGISAYCKTFKLEEANYMTSTSLGIVITIGILWFLLDGIFIKGFLRTSITITNTAFDSTEIQVKFGNIFHQDGWIVVSVNEFFDNTVDDRHVAKETLHGKMLKEYWGEATDDWYKQVTSSISPPQTPQQINRSTAGKTAKYAIGTTGIAQSRNGKKFICVALSPTDVTSCLAKAGYNDLLVSLENALKTARIVCANNPLNVPLMGGSLSRINLPKNMLLNLLIMQIFNASKEQPVTGKIKIVLSYKDFSKYNLKAIQKAWS